MGAVEETRKYCSDCERVTDTVQDQGCVICIECGLIISENRVDDTKDVRIFDDNSKQRIEEATHSTQGILQTLAQGGNGKDGNRMRQTQMQNARINSSPQKDEKIRASHNVISAYADSLNISGHVCNKAIEIYADLLNTKGVTLRGKNPKAIMVGCLYHAGYQLEQPKTLEELAGTTQIPKREISQARKFIKMHIKEPRNNHHNKVSWGPAHGVPHSNLVKAEAVRICTKLQMSYADRKSVEEIADMAQSSLDIRKAPNSQAAAIVWIFMVLNPPMHSQLRVKFSQVIAVSLNTVRQTYNMFLPHLNKILSHERFGEPSQWNKFLQRP